MYQVHLRPPCLPYLSISPNQNKRHKFASELVIERARLGRAIVSPKQLGLPRNCDLLSSYVCAWPSDDHSMPTNFFSKQFLLEIGLSNFLSTYFVSFDQKFALNWVKEKYVAQLIVDDYIKCKNQLTCLIWFLTKSWPLYFLCELKIYLIFNKR